jgi:DDE superfamily endonuclease
MTMVQPKKTPRGGELTPPEQVRNRQISSIRMRIEPAIGGVKRYRIVKDTLRLLKDGIRDAVMETCCGLHNFRLLYRPWRYAHE